MYSFQKTDNHLVMWENLLFIKKKKVYSQKEMETKSRKGQNYILIHHRFFFSSLCLYVCVSVSF